MSELREARGAGLGYGVNGEVGDMAMLGTRIGGKSSC